jgi:hypothetical protein
VAGLSNLFHRLEQVAARIRHGLYARGIQPSAILQLVLRVETEKVGRALSVISSRHLLRLIDDIGKGEAVLRGERLHVVEGVLAVSRSIVGHDRDGADANLAQRLGLRDDAVNARLHIRTVIADENDERALRPAHVGKRVGLLPSTPLSLKSRAFQPKSQMPVLANAIANPPHWLHQRRIMCSVVPQSLSTRRANPTK